MVHLFCLNNSVFKLPDKEKFVKSLLCVALFSVHNKSYDFTLLQVINFHVYGIVQQTISS